ncbi:MAG: periplasmic heavy metal sensor [Alphaproteobacteria bacterium]
MSGRLPWVGLGLSVALNLFIGGAVIGVLIENSRAPTPPPVIEAPAPPPAPAPAPVAATAPPKAAPIRAKAPAPAPAPEAAPPPPEPVQAAAPAPGRAGSTPPAGPGNPLLRAGDKLPPKVRGPYREALREATKASQPKLAAARRARMEVSRLMGARNFDPQAVIAALERARNAEVDARADVEIAMVTFAQTLAPPERRLLAQGLQEGPGRGGQEPGRGGRGPGPGRGVPPQGESRPPVSPQPGPPPS